VARYAIGRVFSGRVVAGSGHIVRSVRSCFRNARRSPPGVFGIFSGAPPNGLCEFPFPTSVVNTAARKKRGFRAGDGGDLSAKTWMTNVVSVVRLTERSCEVQGACESDSQLRRRVGPPRVRTPSTRWNGASLIGVWPRHRECLIRVPFPRFLGTSMKQQIKSKRRNAAIPRSAHRG